MKNVGLIINLAVILILSIWGYFHEKSLWWFIYLIVGLGFLFHFLGLLSIIGKSYKSGTLFADTMKVIVGFLALMGFLFLFVF